MITSIVFDVDDTIYDQQAPYRIAMEKCFPDFDMSHMNQAYIRFRHYSDVGFPRVMAGEWTTEYFRFWRCKETLLEFGYREIDEETASAVARCMEVFDFSGALEVLAPLAKHLKAL